MTTDVRPVPLSLPAAIPSPVVEASDGDEETRAFFQRRLRMIYGVLTGVLGFMTATNWIMWAAGVLPAMFRADFHKVGLALVGLTACMALLWWRCRSERRIPRRTLAVVDVAGILLVSWGLLAFTWYLREQPEAALVQILMVTYFLVGRAILIPSTGRTTVLVAIAVGVPAMVLGSWFRTRYLGGIGSGTVAGNLLVVGRPMLVTGLLSYVASRVIYGLRRQIYEASKVGQYVLEQKIGQGGMGVVYRARHAMLRRETAVKLLLPGKVGEGALARFEREVTMTARLAHPNTVAIYDFGRTPEGMFYYAMEYLDGGDLDDLVSYCGPLPPARVAYLLEQVCRALAEAHGAGLVHRDVKPGNLLISERAGEGDVVKVVDFGLVKDLRADERAPQLTGNRAIAGTPLYMAPEAIVSAAQATAASDVYALGAVAFALLVGEPVFSAGSMVEICAHHLHTPPPPPSTRRAGLAAALDAVVLRCLAKRPEDRYSSVLELRTALLAAAASTGSPWTAADASAWWREHRAPFLTHTDGRRSARLTGSDEDVAFVEERRCIAAAAKKAPAPRPRPVMRPGQRGEGVVDVSGTRYLVKR